MQLHKNFLYICSCFLALLVVSACKKEYKDAAYPFSSITSFKIPYGSADTLRAAITHDSIVVYWSGYKAVPDSITPAIIVSDKATISPASGQKVPLKTGTTYTVTAQDGSVAVYHLYVKVYQNEAVMTTTKQNFNVNTEWGIGGFENLIPDTGLTKLYVIDKNGKEINIPLQTVGVTALYTAAVPVTLVDTGDYRLKVVNNMYTITSTEMLVHVYAAPVITSFNPTKGKAGDVVTITGDYFSETIAANIVTINGSVAEVIAASKTSLQIKVPDVASTGKIAVQVGDYLTKSTGNFAILTAAATTVTTYAGSGTNAIVDGNGINASFRTITGMAFDASGNLYVVENSGNMIRKVTPSGDVSFFAGSGIATFAEGTGATASFYNPVGIARGFNDNFLVMADYWNHRIRKIDMSANTSTFAGSGTRGYGDGTAAASLFNLPKDITVDFDGNVYVSDYGNNRIRKITPAGVVSTLAGSGVAGYTDGVGTAAQFKGPSGIATDALGNVYVADAGNHCIRKITPAGVVTTLAGNGTSGYADGIGSDVRFNAPTGLCIDYSGYIYVADYGNNRIRRIEGTGLTITYAGTGENDYADGPGAEAKIGAPRGITFDASGNIYVSSNYRIRKITPPAE